MTLLVGVFSFLALAALWFACYGGFHQAYVTFREGNTSALTPARFEGVCIANTVWTLYACSLPNINYPLFLGCGAWVLAASLNLLQLLLLPPRRNPVVRIRIAVILILSIAGVAGALLSALAGDRMLLKDLHGTLEWVSVGTTFVLVHLGQILQMRLTAKRESLEGISRWEIIAPFTDWSIFVVYALLLGPVQFWPILVNSLFGFITSGLRFVQYFRMKRAQ